MGRRLIVLAGLLICCPIVCSARMPVDCRVSAGYDGVVSDQGGLFPVEIIIDNKIASTEGVIELSHPDMSENCEAKEVFPFVTPSPSIKKFVLLTRPEQNRDINVTIVFKDYISPISKTVRVQKSDKPLVLCVETPSFYRVGEAARKYRFVNISRSSLSCDPRAFGGVHAVMVSGPASAGLNPDQSKALLQWVATGGTLIFSDSSEDESFQSHFGAVVEKAGVNMGNRGATRFGAGTIAYSGSDAPPNAAFWEGDKKLTDILFPALAEKEDEMRHFYGVTGIFSSLWKTKRSYGWGGIIPIIIIIIAYVCAIGPLDRWITRRLKKPQLTWGLFPMSIAVFSLIAYCYSNMVNVDTMRAVYVNVIDAAPDCQVARGNGFFWVYSAKNATYRMDASLENVHFSGKESALGVGQVAGVDISNGRNSLISARIPVFSSKEFDAAWYMPWPHHISCRRESGTLRIVLPDELKVKSALLADKDGLTRLVNGHDEWYEFGQKMPWKNAISNMASSFESAPYHYVGRSGNNDADLMPKQDVLRDYLICMSFPHDMGKENNNYGSAFYYRQKRDERERSLDIRNRLQTGKTLLLFLEPSSSLMNVNIKLCFPETVRIDLVRIQLPDDV